MDPSARALSPAPEPGAPARSTGQPPPAADGGPPALAEAYAYCSRVARRHYENFPVGSWLLPRRVRPAVHAIYAFARGADDCADEPEFMGRRLEALNHWEILLEEAVQGLARHPIFVALADTIQRHELPIRPFRDLLAAFRIDARGTRFETWDDLLAYCRLSANPVGHLILRLFRYDDPELDALSDHLCTALQLTNFWQDLGIDLGRGRVYLPQQDFAHLGLENRNLHMGRAGGLALGLVAVVVARTREIYEAARPFPDRLRPPLSWEVRAIAAGGRRILDRLERDGLNPLKRRPRLGWLDRLAIFREAFFPARPAARA